MHKKILELMLALTVIFCSLSANADSAYYNKSQSWAGKKKVLITAFEPFEGRNQNNSTLVAQELSRLFQVHPKLNNKFSVELLILPVQALTASNKVKDYVNRSGLAPDMVISMGESAALSVSREALRVERGAYNIKSCSFYDTQCREASDRLDFSNLPENRKANQQWPSRSLFNFPIGDMLCSLHNTDQEAIEVGDNIGNYVCNDTGYNLSLFFRSADEKRDSVAGPIAQLNRSAKDRAAAIGYQLKIDIDNLENVKKAKEDSLVLLKESLGAAQKKYEDFKIRYNQFLASNELTQVIVDYHIRQQGVVINKKHAEEMKNDERNKIKDTAAAMYRELTALENVKNSELRKYNEIIFWIESYTNGVIAAQMQKKARELTEDVYRRLKSELSSFEKIINDSSPLTADGNVPMFGFIHVSSVASKDTHDAESIARKIALMIQGAFDARYPSAAVNFEKRRVSSANGTRKTTWSGSLSCGFDQMLLEDPEYSRASNAFREADRSFTNIKSALRPVLSEKQNKKIEDGDFDWALFVKQLPAFEKSLRSELDKNEKKLNQETGKTRIPGSLVDYSLNREITAQKAALSVISKIPSVFDAHTKELARVNKLQSSFPGPSPADQFFSGYDKFSSAGVYDKLTRKQYLFSIQTDNQVPSHVFLGLDSTGNILQLHQLIAPSPGLENMDEHGQIAFGQETPLVNHSVYDLLPNISPISFGKNLGSGRGVTFYSSGNGRFFALSSPEEDVSNSVRARKDSLLGSSGGARELNTRIEYVLRLGFELKSPAQREHCTPKEPKKGEKGTMIFQPPDCKIVHYLASNMVNYDLLLSYQDGHWQIADRTYQAVDFISLKTEGAHHIKDGDVPARYLSSVNFAFSNAFIEYRNEARKRIERQKEAEKNKTIVIGKK